MVEILLNTRTGAPTAPNYGDRDRVRVDSQAQIQVNPVSAVNAVQQVIPALAPDLVLAAQQIRDNDRVRSDEQRQARAQSQAQSQAQAQYQADYVQDQIDAETENRQATQVTAQITAEIIPLYGKGTANSGDNRSTDSAPLLSQEAFSRANRAYVRAGASDGLTFAASGFDTASRQTLSPSVNLII